MMGHAGALRGTLAVFAVALALGSTACGREESPREESPLTAGWYSNATAWCSYEDARHGREMSMVEWKASGCACARGVGPLDANHYHRRVVAWGCPR